MKPFIRLYKTINSHYFFDVNKNDIIEVSGETYNILSQKEVNSANKEINMLISEGYLSENRAKRVRGMQPNIAENVLKRYMKHLILQLTQRCNLRCTYCAYTTNIGESQGRGHANYDMEWEVAKKAIDFFAMHSIDNPNPKISFYGGEPLLMFELLKQCVTYSENIFQEKNISFAITTNGTLLSDEVVDFLELHNIELTISVDGLKEIHDVHRRFASNGAGSFDVVKKNIMKIKNTKPEFYQNCVINMVVDPQNEFDKISDFFDKDKNEIYDIKTSTSEIEDLFLSDKNVYNPKYTFLKTYNRFLAYLNLFGIVDISYVSPIVQDEIARLFNGLSDIVPMKGIGEEIIIGGTCIPGQKKCLCNYKGELFPCEKINEADQEMIIGDVENGFNYEQIEKLFLYMKGNEKQCVNCWACRNCFICIRATAGNGRYSINGNPSFCVSAQQEFDARIHSLIFLHELQEYYDVKRGGVFNVL